MRVAADDVKLTSCRQGGVCVILGDDHKVMGETAKLAKAKLGCAIYRRPPYYRKAGHVQSEFSKEPIAKRCAHTVQFLQDIELMTHADYFVGEPPLRHCQHAHAGALKAVCHRLCFSYPCFLDLEK